jgi:hypothetical protein
MSDSESNFQDELSEEIDAGGCAETWETLSARRQESSADRRSFLGHVAATLGIVPAGGALMSETASAHDGHGSEDPDIEVTPIRGRERGQLLRRANNSDEVAFTADVLGEKPGVEKVIEYEMDEQSGKGVIFGSTEANGTTIKYFESEDSTRVTGATPVGDGVRSVDAENRVVHDIGTPTVETAVGGVDADEAVSTGKYETAELDRAMLVRSVDERPLRFDVFVPIVSDDEVVDRTVIQGTGELSNPDSTEILTGGDEVGTQGHVICGPTGTICTNYCSVLCGALAGLAGAACTAKCAGTIAGLPISPACGAVCAGVVAGTCVPTCTNLAH